MPWSDWRNRASPHYAEPRNHALVPGGTEYGRYQWVKSHVCYNQRVLDAGCNCGQLAENLTLDLGCQVVGVDVIPDFIEHCQTRKAKFGRFVLGDFGRMGADDLRGLSPDGTLESFDVVTMLEVLEHPVRVRDFINGAWHSLRWGGKLIVTVPHPEGVTGYAQKEAGEAPYHVRMWTRARLEAGLSFRFGCPVDYVDIRRDACGRLLSMGMVWVKGRAE